MSVLVVKDKVQRYLADFLGTASMDGDGDFFVNNGSSVTFIRVSEWHDDIALIKVWSILLRNVPLTPELFRWVAVEGQEYFFGHARVVVNDDGTGRVQFEHVLLGDYIDAEELRAAVVGIAGSSDDLDDELQAKFGGEKFITS